MKLKPALYLFIVLFVIVTLIKGYSNLKTSIIDDATVEKLITQPKYNQESGTTYRYIIITNKGTFICEDSFENGKFNNTDIFYHLQVGKKYKFTVVGWGKGFFNDYQNIINVEDK